MIMEDAFLNCNIFSIHSIDQPYIDLNFFLVSNVYYYNSLKSGIFNFDPECIQIPEIEIQDRHLLDGLDFDFINNHSIPILYRNKDIWKIDLRLYEDYKLQSRNIQQN
jgi:hypothetical protein